MVDSIAVLDPGFRATDNNGNLITDGILAFFDAGTSNTRTVYSDANLSTSLGVTVTCNSAGMPVSSGNAKVLIYTGSSAYKIRLTSVIFGGTVWEFDNVRGALDTSTFLTEAAVADRNIVNVSTDRAVTIADKGSLLNVNCSAAAISLTFDDASDCEGLWVGIRHDGTANQVKITGDGTDTFGIPGVNVTAFSLTGRGQTVWISCDGASFKIENECPPLIMGNIGVIAIADRLATPPASPNPGQRYILTSAPTGAWSTFAEHDIAEANGFGGWFKYTPSANCGWVAYVQDENFCYQFKNTAWVTEIASESLWGLVKFATDAEMEAKTATRAVQPSNQHRHPGHPKAWGVVTGGGTPALAASENITSITDTGDGILGITIATDFSGTTYACIATATGSTTAGQADRMVTVRTGTEAAGTIQIQSVDAGGAFTDPAGWNFAMFGDQA